MDDFIEREAALESVREKLRISDALPDSIAKRASVFTLASMNDSLKSIPAADVRPVVLCRECKYAQMAIDGLCKYCDRLTEIGVDDAVYLPEDFFCAAGEKKEES